MQRHSTLNSYLNHGGATQALVPGGVDLRCRDPADRLVVRSEHLITDDIEQ